MGTTVMGGEALSTQIENLHSPGCERMWFISSPPSLASEPRLEVADEAIEAGIMGGLREASFVDHPLSYRTCGCRQRNCSHRIPLSMLIANSLQPAKICAVYGLGQGWDAL